MEGARTPASPKLHNSHSTLDATSLCLDALSFFLTLELWNVSVFTLAVSTGTKAAARGSSSS